MGEGGGVSVRSGHWRGKGAVMRRWYAGTQTILVFNLCLMQQDCATYCDPSMNSEYYCRARLLESLQVSLKPPNHARPTSCIPIITQLLRLLHAGNYIQLTLVSRQQIHLRTAEQSRSIPTAQLTARKIPNTPAHSATGAPASNFWDRNLLPSHRQTYANSF